MEVNFCERNYDVISSLEAKALSEGGIGITLN